MSPQETETTSAGTAQSWRRRSGWVLVSLALIALAAWYGLRAPDIQGSEIRMAVLPVDDRTGQADLAWARFGLMSYAASLLEAEGSFPLVSEGSVVSLASNLEWDNSLDSDSGQKLLERLASAYGSSHVLFLQLENEGQALRMNYLKSVKINIIWTFFYFEKNPRTLLINKLTVDNHHTFQCEWN